MYNLPLDKANHYFYGSWVALLGSMIMLWQTQSLLWGAAGSLLAVVVGGLKELSDWVVNKIKKAPVHGVEWQDALATGAAAVPVGAPLILLFIKAQV